MTGGVNGDTRGSRGGRRGTGGTGLRLLQKVSSTRLFAKAAPHVVPRLDRAVHRLTRGRAMLSGGALTSVLLTVKGARTGAERRTPLACVPEESGTWLLVGSNFGRPDHPAWTANLRHSPDAEISLKGTRVPVRARELAGEERAEAWATALAAWPPYAVYQARVERQIRLFRLERRDG